MSADDILTRGRTFRAIVQEDEIQFRDPAAVLKHIKSLKGKQVTVTIRRWIPPRSDQQNKYWHGVVLPMFADEAGLDLVEAKQVLKMHFLPIWIGEGANRIQTCRRTRDLDVGEMSKFTDDCRRLAADMFGLNIPDPSSAAGQSLLASVPEK